MNRVSTLIKRKESAKRDLELCRSSFSRFPSLCKNFLSSVPVDLLVILIIGQASKALFEHDLWDDIKEIDVVGS